MRTPEDIAPPWVVARAAALTDGWQTEITPGVVQLLRDRVLLEVHKLMLPPPRRRRVDPIDATLLHARAKLDEAETLEEALAALAALELAAALGDLAAVERLSALPETAGSAIRPNQLRTEAINGE